MKVCFVGVSDSFPSFAGENTRVLELANNLVELGVEVHIIAPRMRSPRTVNQTGDNLCKAFIHESRVRFRLPGFYYGSTIPNQLKSLAKLQKREKFDLIHAHMFWGGPIGLLAKRMVSARAVFDPHDWYFCDLYNLPLIKDTVEMRTAKSLAATLVTGHRLREFLIRRGISQEKLHVVPNGVRREIVEHPRPEERELRRIRLSLKLREAQELVTFLGELSNYQGIDILIRAMKHVRGNVDAKLAIIGDGPERMRLKAIVENLGLTSAVLFLGRVPWASLMGILDASSVTVVPFRKNRYTEWIQPIKVFEYFARGRAVVASKLYGVSEVVRNEVNGLLVPPENIEALSAALSKLLKDEDLRDSMGRNGKNVVSGEYTWGKAALQLKKVYEGMTR